MNIVTHCTVTVLCNNIFPSLYHKILLHGFLLQGFQVAGSKPAYWLEFWYTTHWPYSVCTHSLFRVRTLVSFVGLQVFVCVCVCVREKKGIELNIFECTSSQEC